MNRDDPHPLPPHVRWLGVLLQSMADRLAQALDPATLASCAQQARSRTGDLEARAQRQVGHLTRCAEQAGRTWVRLQEQVLSVPRCDDATVHDAWQPLRRELEALVDHFHDLHRLRPCAVDEARRRQLIRMSRSVLQDFQAGLSDLAAQLADPLTELRRRGLPLGGEVTLNLTLTLRRPPGVRRIGFWLRQRARQRERQQEAARRARRQRRDGPSSSWSSGLWGLAVGWMLGHFGS